MKVYPDVDFYILKPETTENTPKTSEKRKKQ